MVYRILKSPPGYPEGQQYMVVEYEKMEITSSVKDRPGWTFAATLEDARRLIPTEAVRLPFEPMNQFLELYSKGRS